MPVYAFEMEGGGVEEHFFTMKEVPPLEQFVELRAGVRGRRIFEPPQIQKPREYKFASHQVPRHHPAAPRHDKDGRACFESKREVQEFMAKTGWGYD